VKTYFTESEVREIDRKAHSIHEKMDELFDLDVDSSPDERNFLDESEVNRTEERRQQSRAKKDESGKEPKAPKDPSRVTQWDHETLSGEGMRTGQWLYLFNIGRTLKMLGSLKR
jgi:hypothetical protein